MASDLYLLERMRNILQLRGVQWQEKRMFGGDCFMVDDKMCFGTYQGGIMARVNPMESALLGQKPGASAMIHGGKAMPGYIMLRADAYDKDVDLEFWIDKCLEYNPLAKSSKKR